MQRLFISSKDFANNVISLNKEQFHHLVNVCRLKPKNKLEVVVNNTRLILVKIKHIDLNQFHVDILDQWSLNTSRQIPIQLMQSLPKQDKLTDICRTCTEVGVQKFHPIVTDFCDVKSLSDNKLKRVKMAIESAAKQSKQSAVPTITPIMKITDIFDTVRFNPASLKLVAYENSNESLKNIVTNIPKEVVIAIGPEGGFSEKDIDIFMENDFIPFSLGNHILRTEHAGFASICYLDGYLDSLKK